MRVQFNLFGILLASSNAFADSTVNLTPGVTPLSHDIYHLHMLIFWICVAIGVIVFGIMFYSIIYHRKSSGFQAAPFHENLGVELLWTLVPLLILIFMAVPATKVLIQMNDSEKEDLTIKITGYQWKWKYEYLNQGVSFFSNISPPDNLADPHSPTYIREVDHPLIVPIHKKIRFLVTANDVIHSWWVPDLGVKRDALPGFINEAWARINRAGTYYGQCTELCGINHAYMPIVVTAMTETAFEQWLAQQKGHPLSPKPVVTQPSISIHPGAVMPTTAVKTTSQKLTLDQLMQKGEKIYLGTCAVCHQASGEGMPPTFPALKGSPIVMGPAAAHIDRVLNGKPGTAMQAFKEQLNDEDLAAVITYERNALGNKTGTEVQPSDIATARGLSGAHP